MWGESAVCVTETYSEGSAGRQPVAPVLKWVGGLSMKKTNLQNLKQ